MRNILTNPQINPIICACRGLWLSIQRKGPLLTLIESYYTACSKAFAREDGPRRSDNLSGNL